MGSGSAGNSALLQTDNTRVLVDAGFSAKRLAELLEKLGETLEAIDAGLAAVQAQHHPAQVDTTGQDPGRLRARAFGTSTAPIFEMMSPGRIPAACAGEAGSTQATTGAVESPFANSTPR